MVYKLCSAESAIATCDSTNYKPKLGRKNNQNQNRNHYRHEKHRNQLKLRHFTAAELDTATNGFSPTTLLGKGSHGAVYKAVLDSGSLIAAVKKPTTAARGAAENEIDILSKINHKRIVNLIGYTVPDQVNNSNNTLSIQIQTSQKFKIPPTKKVGPICSELNRGSNNNELLLLVVEYMQNGSLYDLLHTNTKPPTWLTRIRIALHVAEAVQTLHGSDPPVIHRDIKSSNVLLDYKHNARLSDFGLALCGNAEDVRVMRTPPAGTLGYLDPSYISPADVSTKSDIFSLGILLLEIISGRRAIDVNYSPPVIVEWALPLIKAGNFRAIIDSRIGCNVDLMVIRELALLAARCVRSTAEKRPRGSEVVECLKMVYKRMKWEYVLKWRVRSTEKSRPVSEIELDDRDEVKTSMVQHGSRRTRKISNVAIPENRLGEMATSAETIGGRTGRSKSKSVGSFREIKEDPVGSEGGDNCEIISGNYLVKQRTQRAQVTVKLSSVVKLSKSRSMSVLHSSKNGSQCGNFLGKNPEVKEFDVLPLLVDSICTSSNSSGLISLKTRHIRHK